MQPTAWAFSGLLHHPMQPNPPESIPVAVSSTLNRRRDWLLDGYRGRALGMWREFRQVDRGGRVHNAANGQGCC